MGRGGGVRVERGGRGITLGHEIKIESGHRPRLLIYIYVRTGPEIASVPCSL